MILHNYVLLFASPPISVDQVSILEDLPWMFSTNCRIFLLSFLSLIVYCVFVVKILLFRLYKKELNLRTTRMT